MPEVTSVEPQKKIKDRFNIYLDGKFTLGANLDTVLKYQIYQGKKVSNSTVDRITKEEELAKYFDATLKYLSFRPRSQKEVEDYLISRISKKEKVKFSQAKESKIVFIIISKLKKYKYLNDNEFSKWWIKSRINTRPRGKMFIKSELIKKGIQKDTIDNLLNKIKNQTPFALKAVEKKLPRWQKLPEPEFKNKVYRYLTSRGFDFETIREAVAKINKKR